MSVKKSTSRSLKALVALALFAQSSLICPAALAAAEPEQAVDTARKFRYGNFTLDGPLELLVADPSEVETVDCATTTNVISDSDNTVLSGTASISPELAPDRIDDLTRQILLKEIELQRFNLNYTINVARQGRWKGWRYAGLQEVNSGMGLTGAIISTSYRGARLDNPGAVKPCIQQTANFIPMIGSIIGASAAVLEFGINGYHDIVARRKGFSPSAAMKFVRGVKADIDRLMAEREQLVRVLANSPTLAVHSEIAEVEGRILKDIRDQSLQEFQRFHVGARKLIAFQQMQYFFDFAKYTTNAIGYEFAYLSLHRGHRVWNGRAGVLFIVSGQLTMAAPILSRFFAKGVGEITKRRIRPIVGDAQHARIETLQADLARLNTLMKESRIQPDATDKAAQRVAAYSVHQDAFAAEITDAQKKNARAKLTATQNIGAGLFVGGAKTASGILFVIPGFNSNFNTTGFRANRVTNDLLFTASVIAIPALSFSIVDTLRIQIQGEIARHKAAKAGMLPGQIVAERMKQLDAMEKRLLSAK